MKKKVLIPIIILIVIVVAVSIVVHEKSDYSRILEYNWGFELPDKARCKEDFQKDSGDSFHGDGIRYHVYEVRNEAPIDALFSWGDLNRETIYHESIPEAAEAWLSEIQVPGEERPEYEDCVCWYEAKEDNSELIVLWDRDEEELYILESFL